MTAVYSLWFASSSSPGLPTSLGMGTGGHHAAIAWHLSSGRTPGRTGRRLMGNIVGSMSFMSGQLSVRVSMRGPTPSRELSGLS
eukprot:CAMPEP_0119130962 /NCGR_PEP_ID=MMETSP1310-20130426/9093_1 /TAXON_ID=464262 /ORGANISM="Genus nov. species nov., Strain RCC2339" /LENGTH=83 /DNA_ID=CAMNT_0007121507 /DNA_START=109 /DNA_END=357 /DNA_ORIENTATION=-